MYVTFPGFSKVKAGLLDFFQKNGIKTGRSYSGKIDGFHHLPFQMDIEASLYTDVDVYIVGVNIAYEQIIEDENFHELTRLHDAGVSKNDIYLQDLRYIIKEFCSDKKKGKLSIKFGQPRKIDTSTLKGGLVGRKIKTAAHKYAEETYNRVLSMQPIFPANIYFSAFDDNFNSIPLPDMKEKIENIRDHLRTLTWGNENQPADLYHIMGYNQQIVSANEIINRTFQNFNEPGRHITDIDGDMFVVYNKDVAQQYKNHTAHFFEDLKK
jgi:glycerol-3-phosphate O-acyltransferase